MHIKLKYCTEQHFYSIETKRDSKLNETLGKV